MAKRYDRDAKNQQLFRIFLFRCTEKPQTWEIKPSFTIDYVNSVPKYCRLQIEPKREYRMSNFNNFEEN